MNPVHFLTIGCSTSWQNKKSTKKRNACQTLRITNWSKRIWSAPGVGNVSVIKTNRAAFCDNSSSFDKQESVASNKQQEKDDQPHKRIHAECLHFLNLDQSEKKKEKHLLTQMRKTGNTIAVFILVESVIDRLHLKCRFEYIDRWFLIGFDGKLELFVQKQKTLIN